jgi:hypothetical protein
MLVIFRVCLLDCMDKVCRQKVEWLNHASLAAGDNSPQAQPVFWQQGPSRQWCPPKAMNDDDIAKYAERLHKEFFTDTGIDAKRLPLGEGNKKRTDYINCNAMFNRGNDRPLPASMPLLVPDRAVLDELMLMEREAHVEFRSVQHVDIAL